MDRTRILCSLSLAFLGITLAFGAPPTGRQPLFEAEDPLTMRLEAPFGLLERQKDNEPEWLDGRMILSGVDGDRTFEIKVKARGQFRRLSGECDFPTFWINFKKSEVGGTVFDGQDKLKVVSHCRESRKFYDRYLHREYLAYKTYNLLTEASFQVRLVRMTYVYTDRRGRTTQRPAFLIEDDDLLARRLGGTVVENQIVLPEFLEPAALNLADVFQYMIGNTDYDHTAGHEDCCHNSKVVAFASREATFIPVPYDFDMSGIVDAPYARPDSRLDISRVTERVYRGIEAPAGVIDGTLAAYRQHKDEILALWTKTPLLEDKDRKHSVRFLEQFFKELEDPQALAKNLVSHSRSRAGVRASLEKNYQDAFQKWQDQ